MSENQQEAAELAKRAGRQTKNAAKNGIRATQATAKAVADSVTEEAQDTAVKLEATAEDAVRSLKGRDVRQAVALTAVFLGGTYLVGRIAGARQARRMTAHNVVDVVADTPAV